MRAAIYARLSLEREANAENIDIQLRECRGYAEDQGWVVVAEFADSDISASRYSRKPRPQYNQLLEAVRAGDVECIVITEMPRLYRRLEELLELMYLAEKTALKRIETTDGLAYDLSTGFGIHNAVAAVNTAMFESRKLSDRIKRKRREEAKNGRSHGGTRPYGYEAGGMVVREAEAAIIREIAERLLDGESQREIVKDLNRRKVPTAQNGTWQIHNVTRIMTSKRIVGVRVHRGAEYPGNWPPILDSDTWERLQTIFAGHTAAIGKGARSYLLTGFLRCGLCGNALIAGAIKGPVETAPRRRYRCRRLNVSTGIETGCGKISRLAEPVEDLVANAVLYRLDSPQMERMLHAGDPNIEGLIATYAVQKSRLDDLLADYASGLLNRQQLAQTKAMVEEAMEATRLKLAKAESGRRLGSIPAGKTLREAWETASLEWRRQLIDLLIERIVLLPGRPGAKRYKQWGFDPDAMQIHWRVQDEPPPPEALDQ
jgi:site-specific DNA recombinase